MGDIHKRAKGNKGENIACSFLENRGFVIIERNYLKKWGEIDIIAQKDRILHFFEVKSVTFSVASLAGHRPEDNVHGLKTKRLRRTIESYLFESGGGMEKEFQFHVLCVYMNTSSRRASVKWLKNLII